MTSLKAVGILSICRFDQKNAFLRSAFLELENRLSNHFNRETIVFSFNQNTAAYILWSTNKSTHSYGHRIWSL